MYTECPEMYNATSPVTYASPSVAATMGFYGDVDLLVPNIPMDIMQSLFEDLGVVSSFTRYPGGHGDWELQMDMTEQIRDFLRSFW